MKTEYFTFKKVADIPRLPLEGILDLTYRCNNNCRHCWLRIAPHSPEKRRELTIEELREIVDEGRQLGCRKWGISGGEPMLRPDFEEFFDYVTGKTASYSLNTNGTLITPRIAKLMRRKGNKMVVLYGATAEVHDHITRNPGSFEAAMQGAAYLKEAGAGFTLQLVPMRDNYHQFKSMIKLAESLSQSWRIGASWLYLRARGDQKRNQEIRRQRLDPRIVVELDRPDFSFEDWMEREVDPMYCRQKEDDRLFAPCIASRRDFHIDPYGQMSFCCFIKDPALRYDLRKGSMRDCWEKFILSLKDRIRGGEEYLENCASCELRAECRWCPVYGYLEHGRYSAKVEYLCAVAEENRKFKENWKKNHCRFYQIAGISLQVESDLPIKDTTFDPKFKLFEKGGPGEDNIIIKHHFSLPDLQGQDLGKEVYRKPPWAIYKKGYSWVYLGISPLPGDNSLHQVVVASHDHTRAHIHNPSEESFRKGGLQSLSLLPTDQILLARVLANREACYFHSSGVILREKGLLFVGHSEAGKSTLVRILRNKAEILCDDRIIVRKWAEGFKIHGTWSHGEVSEVSPSSAPLRGIFFLEKSQENCLVLIKDKKKVIRKLLACLVKPLLTADWWERMLSLMERIVAEVPCYVLHFDKSGKAVELLEKL